MKPSEIRKRLIPVIIVLAIAGGGYWWWSANQDGGAGHTPALGGNGTIEADQVAITPQAGGRIIEAPVDEGVTVDKGEVLFRLDAKLLKLQVEQADAGVRAARANYVNVRDDDDSSKADRSAALARLDQAKVAKRMAIVQSSYATVKSPLAGVLTTISAHPGENASPGAALAVISDTSRLDVSIFVPEPRVAEVSIDQEATLGIDAAAPVASGKRYRARVVFISTNAEFAPSTLETKEQRVKLVYKVKLRVIDPDESLKPGMPVDVRF